VSNSGRQEKESSEEKEIVRSIQQGGKFALYGRTLHPDSFNPRT
jgi:hypothetical protein